MSDRALVATSTADLTRPDILSAFAAFLRLNVAQGTPHRRRSEPITPGWPVRDLV